MCGRLAALILLCLALGSASGSAQVSAPTCFGAPATIVGTEGNDSIDGTPGPDVIVTLGGDDVVRAGAGDDRICTGPGADAVFAGDGNDSIDTGEGIDAIEGGPGNDTIIAGEGTADGAYYLTATGPVHVDLSAGVATGEGTDTLQGVESVVGSEYGDKLIGDATINALLGLGGDDTLDGGPNSDVLLGAAGNDTLIGNAGDGDTAAFVLAPQGVQADLQTGVATGEGRDVMTNIESLMGSLHNDTLLGNERSNFLLGLGGNDVLEGRGGDDVLYGEYPGLPNELFGAPGMDRLDGGNGNDKLFGGPGADVLIGGAGTGDAVSYIDSMSGVHVDLGASRAGGEGADRITGVEGVSGSAFADQLIGDAKPNALFANDGNDMLSGGGGADFLGGGNGKDTARGGGGTDYCLDDEIVSQCEIRGTPPVVGTAEPPPRARRNLIVDTAGQAVWGLAAVRLLLTRSRASATVGPRTSNANSAVRTTAPYEYSAEPVCIPAKGGGVTEIAPPNVVDPVGDDGAREEAWWQGTLLRRNPKSGRYAYRQAKTSWARTQLGGGGLPGGIVVWKDTSGRRAYQSPVVFRVPRGRYVWIGQLYWVRSGGKIFAPIEPHIIRARTIRHNKDCDFR